MLYEFILHLQAIEISFWKRGIQPTLALLRDSVKKKTPATITFPAFARSSIETSDKRPNTKENLLSTVNQLELFRPKHLRQLRTLINEAISDGYIPADAYPFRKFKIKQEKGRHEFLTPDELRKLENLEVNDKKLRHVLDAFLFCCYTGLRFSDFCQLNYSNFAKINGKKWLHFKSIKTGIELRLPLHLLFEGKALAILDRYEITKFSCLGSNAETNKALAQITGMARIKKHVTYHTARHTCATLLIHQGVPITTVQKLLGHTSVKTTEIYSEILSNTIVRDLKAIKRKRNVNSFHNVVRIG